MKRYLLTVIFFVFAVLFAVALVNFFVDPGAVYFNRLTKAPLLDAYTDALIDSPYGMRQEGWKERDVKLSLATKVKGVQCIVLGSSHVMSLSIYQQPALKKYCPSLMNLGASSASIEDLAIFSEKLLQSGGVVKNKKILIGVDPWALNFNRSSSYLPYSSLYYEFLNRVNMSYMAKGQNRLAQYRADLVGNIINDDYFQESRKLISRDGYKKVIEGIVTSFNHYRNKNEYILTQTMQQFDVSKGASVAVTLADGGHVYSSKYIDEAIHGEHGLDAVDYQLIWGEWYDPRAVKLFASMISLMQKSGYKVVILLTPYHQNVWDKPSGSLTRQAMNEVSSLVTKLADTLGLQILGSFDPRSIGCDKTEFFDYMHPQPSCLDKIFQAQR